MRKMAARLLDIVFPAREDALLLRPLEPSTFLSSLEPRVLVRDGLSVTALLRYEKALVRAAVVESKYHGSRHATRLLATALADYLLDELADRAAYGLRHTTLVPVPLSHARRQARGYNQSEILAQEALRCLKNMPPVLVDLDPLLLVRQRDTSPQTSLSGASRRANLKGAFITVNVLDPERQYILLDDVVTTGATLAGAVEALHQAGAPHILPLALAHSGKIK